MKREEIPKKCFEWWNSIQENKGAKAQLKRCGTPVEAALHPETHRLKNKLPPWLPIECVATIAGVSAHIKNSNSFNFGEALAKPKENNGRPRLSENRFRQLLSCRDWDELYRGLRRSVTILDGNVNLSNFVETVLLWNDEFHESFRKPGKSIKYKLSQDYYSEVIRHEK